MSASATGAAGPLSVALMIETVIMGGAEQVVLQMTEELRSRGHAVHPIVPAGREGWLLDRFQQAGISWHTYDLRRPVDFGLPGRMANTLTRLAVDVVHSHEFVMAVYGAAAARRVGVPHIVTMHGNQNMTARWRRRVALRWAFRRSHATVAVSEATRRHLETTLGLRPGIVEVIQNGIPVRYGDRSRVRREIGIAPSELLLLSVGNLIERKGHAVLIRALAQIDQREPRGHWRLAIAGEGVERPRLEALIRDYGLADRVHLLGARNDIPDLQAAADVFVMPSLWEGLPLAVLEAMVAGKPIVASRTSGIPEAIEDGRHGLLTPPGDVRATADALRRVMLDADLRVSLGQAALERARSSFTIGAMVDRYEQLYRKHLA